MTKDGGMGRIDRSGRVVLMIRRVIGQPDPTNLGRIPPFYERRSAFSDHSHLGGREKRLPSADSHQSLNSDSVISSL
jgi:hypothetical protein